MQQYGGGFREPHLHCLSHQLRTGPPPMHRPRGTTVAPKEAIFLPPHTSITVLSSKCSFPGKLPTPCAIPWMPLSQLQLWHLPPSQHNLCFPRALPLTLPKATFPGGCLLRLLCLRMCQQGLPHPRPPRQQSIAQAGPATWPPHSSSIPVLSQDPAPTGCLCFASCPSPPAKLHSPVPPQGSFCLVCQGACPHTSNNPTTLSGDKPSPVSCCHL